MSDRDYYSLFMLPFLILALLLTIDHIPRFYFGDSSAYLMTGVGNIYPTERSWIYGLAARGLMKASQSLDSVILLQTWIRAAAIGLAAIAIAKYTHNKAAAVVVIVLLSLDPLGLYYDRAILTDSPASALFISLVCLIALSYSTQRNTYFVAALVCIVPLAATILLLRVAYMPVLATLVVVAVGAGIATSLGFLGAQYNARRLYYIGASIGFGILLPPLINGQLTAMGYSYNPHSNKMLLSVFSPAIKEKHLKKAGLSYGDNFKAIGTDNFDLRNHQLWSRTGLIKTLEASNAPLGPQEFERRLKRLRNIMVTRNLAGVLKVISFNFAAAASPYSFSSSNAAYVSEIKQNIKFEAEWLLNGHINPFIWGKIQKDLPTIGTLSDRYLLASGYVIWLAYIVCLLSPLGARFILPEARIFYYLVSISGFVYALSTSIFSVFVVPRYMAPLIPLATLAATILFVSLAATRDIPRAGEEWLRNLRRG